MTDDNKSAPGRRPNILLFFCDQLRGDAVGALGNAIIRTPNLDRLCREGVAFTSAYTPSPVCIAARCSMHYGQYPHNTGCYENTPMPTDGRQSFMDALRTAGYRTHGIGKCHFSPDSGALRGFQTRERQEELVGSPQDDDYLLHLHENGFGHVCDPHGIRGEMYYVPQPSQIPAELHPSQWVGDRSVAFVEQAAENDEPWFLFSSYVHPHPPFTPPNPWHKLYRAPLMPLPRVPADFESLLTFVNRVQNRYKYRDQGIDKNLLRCMKAYYYACVSFVDYQVGRVLAALERTGQLDNTLIVFTADHGEHLGDYHCFGKRSMHDTAARVPLLVRSPREAGAATVCDAPSSLVDIAPTFLAAADASLDSHALDGVDLLSLARGETDREVVFGQLAYTEARDSDSIAANSSYMAVSREWKYFYSAPDDYECLFDRRRDPLETRNCAGLPLCQDACEEMKRALLDHLREGGETAGIDDGDWKRFPVQTVPANPDAALILQDHPWADTSVPGYTSPGDPAPQSNSPFSVLGIS